MVVWTLARKDFRVLIRDPRALIILIAMPMIFIMVLGVSLGEGFGQKPADRLKVSVLVLDEGVPRHFDRPAMLREGLGWLASTRDPWPGMTLAIENQRHWFPRESWSDRLLKDLKETADIRVETVADRAEAEMLVRTSKRAAVLILGPKFSRRVSRCSFLAPGWKETFGILAYGPKSGDPIGLALHGLFNDGQNVLPLYLVDGMNPFHREGVNLAALDVEVLRDPTQQTAAAIIDQVAQGSMLRVVMPWMIGRAFEKISDPSFLALLAEDKQIPLLVGSFLKNQNPLVTREQRNLSVGLQNALQRLFPRYKLTAKTWAELTKSTEVDVVGAGSVQYAEDGVGWLRRGSSRYQLLVPSYLVMFAFFLVLTVGWLIVAERRQGTLKRLSLAPVSRVEILAGKLLPCLFVSLFQGLCLLGAGKLLFGMAWGTQPIWLIAVVAATSLAAMGLALWIATLARTETQVAIYGTLLVLVLAGLSGCLMGDRAMMPERMQQISRVTPHAWALDAYRQLLTNPVPDLSAVATSCAVLVAFGVGFFGLAWWSMRWE